MRRKTKALTLRNGSKIAIIGAGPAGTFFADVAAEIASSKGIEVSIALFDGKDFTQKGIGGCNLCAGVISETLEMRLRARGIVLPDEKVQQKIEGYSLNGKTGSVLLRHPLKRKRITTVFRGNGPRLSNEWGNVSFDDYLLKHARSKGSRVIRRLVKRVELSEDPGTPLKIFYAVDKEELVYEADLVVGAFGLSRGMMSEMQALGFGYRPPGTVRAWNVEIRLGSRFIREKFGSYIHIYNWGTARGLSVACIIPKKDYITVNLIAERDVGSKDLQSFLHSLALQKKLPEDWRWADNVCSCSPLVATTPALRPFTDRLVIIGDASCSRYYKNGIESAFVTANAAADTAFHSGISESDFEKSYYRRIKKIIINDNFYGKIMFRINDLVAGSPLLSKVMFEIIHKELKAGTPSKMRDTLWNMYTGNIPYRSIFLDFTNPALQWQLTAMTFRIISGSLIANLSALAARRNESLKKDLSK